MLIAPNALPSDIKGRTIEEAYPLFNASFRQGLKSGSVSMFLQMAGFPVRMAVPVGPRPRSVSAQVMFTVSR